LLAAIVRKPILLLHYDKSLRLVGPPHLGRQEHHRILATRSYVSCEREETDAELQRLIGPKSRKEDNRETEESALITGVIVGVSLIPRKVQTELTL
jgi:hypothetical protein